MQQTGKNGWLGGAAAPLGLAAIALVVGLGVIAAQSRSGIRGRGLEGRPHIEQPAAVSTTQVVGDGRPAGSEQAAVGDPRSAIGEGAASEGAVSGELSTLGAKTEPIGMKTGGSGPRSERDEPTEAVAVLGKGLLAHAGPCADPVASGARAQYLAEFAVASTTHRTLYAHASTPRVAIRWIDEQIDRQQELAQTKLGIVFDLPPIFVYPSLSALRDHACTSKNALAYYDGAIHVVGSTPLVEHELIKSLLHELAHHALVSRGVGAPLWFQEGTAIWLSRDAPFNYWAIWRKHPIDLARMVEPLPPATPEQATIFDAQAYVMIDLLDRLCLGRPGCSPVELVRALTSGKARPDTLFEWAIRERSADLVASSHNGIWLDFAEYGSFPPRTMQALVARSSPPR